jgi:hypothetical protein
METCDFCQEEILINKDSCSTGYALNQHKKKLCYKCCAAFDKANMIEQGKYVLFLTKKDNHYSISNWPGTLKFKNVFVKVGKHNIAGCRYDAWFNGPDDKKWHGVQYGDNTEIVHVKRIK